MSLAIIDKIEKLKAESLKLPQVAVPIKNYFSDGTYAREMYVRAGTTITGKVHKYSTVDVLLQGVIMVLTDDGTLQKLSAPMVFESVPGRSKAGHVLEDVRWITIHGNPTNEQDIESLEHELVVEDYAQYLAYCETLKLKGH